MYAKSIWDLPGAPERTEGSDEEVEEYFRSMEELEAMRESITEEDTLTEDAQNDLLTNGPGSIYARAAGDTGGTWDEVSEGKWKYILPNGSYAKSQWVKHPVVKVDVILLELNIVLRLGRVRMVGIREQMLFIFQRGMIWIQMLQLKSIYTVKE